MELLSSLAGEGVKLIFNTLKNGNKEEMTELLHSDVIDM